jgi:predicted  nucleic acid-binding Zn-ribbon protein
MSDFALKTTDVPGHSKCIVPHAETKLYLATVDLSAFPDLLRYLARYHSEVQRIHFTSTEHLKGREEPAPNDIEQLQCVLPGLHITYVDLDHLADPFKTNNQLDPAKILAAGGAFENLENSIVSVRTQLRCAFCEQTVSAEEVTAVLELPGFVGKRLITPKLLFQNIDSLDDKEIEYLEKEFSFWALVYSVIEARRHGVDILKAISQAKFGTTRPKAFYSAIRKIFNCPSGTEKTIIPERAVLRDAFIGKHVDLRCVLPDGKLNPAFQQRLQILVKIALMNLGVLREAKLRLNDISEQEARMPLIPQKDRFAAQAAADVRAYFLEHPVVRADLVLFGEIEDFGNRSEAERLRRHIDELTAEVKKLRAGQSPAPDTAGLARLRDERERSKEAERQARAELKLVQEELETLKADKDEEHEASFKALEAELERLRVEHEALQKITFETEQRADELKRELKKTKTELEEARRTALEAQQRLAELESAAQESPTEEQDVSKLRAELASAESRARLLDAQMLKLRGQVRVLEGQLSMKDGQIKLFKQTISSLKKSE